MEIPKPSEADKDFFRSVLPDDPAVEVKPMFGNLGAFVHGNMFAGLFGPAVGVRLDDAGRPNWRASTAPAPSARPSARWAGTPACPKPGAARPTWRRSGWSGRSPMSARLPPKVKKPKAPRK